MNSLCLKTGNFFETEFNWSIHQTFRFNNFKLFLENNLKCDCFRIFRSERIRKWKDSLHLWLQKERAGIWKHGQHFNSPLPSASVALEFELQTPHFHRNFNRFLEVMNKMLPVIISFIKLQLIFKIAASKLINPLQFGCFISLFS